MLRRQGSWNCDTLSSLANRATHKPETAAADSLSAHRSRRHQYAELTALAGLYAIAAGMGGAKTLQSLGMLLLLIGSLAVPVVLGRRLAREPLTAAVVLFFLYLMFSATYVAWGSGMALMHWDMARKMSRVLLLPIAAYWLMGRQDRVNRFLLFGLAGILVVVAEQIVHWGGVGPLFSGQRTGFRINPIWMGLNGSIAVLGLIAYRRRLIAASQDWLPPWTAFALWTFLLAIMLQVVIVSQSRGAYIALTAGLFVLAAFRVHARAKRNVSITAGKVAGAALVLVAVAAFIVSQWSTLESRVLAEKSTIEAITNGDLRDLPTTPIGQRLYMYRAGLEAYTEKPWIGWGPDGSRTVIKRADIPESIRHDHLHNGPLDALVRFGLIGAMLFYSIPALLVCSLWRAWVRGRVPAPTACFLSAALATYAVADLTESYMASGFGWSVLIVIGGITYTVHIWPRHEDASADVERDSPDRDGP